MSRKARPHESASTNPLLPKQFADMPETPFFLIDLAKLRANLEILARVKEEAGCRIVHALKAFSLPQSFPLIAEYLDGTCASGLWEARLAHEDFPGSDKAILTCSPAYRDDEIAPLLDWSTQLDFNSPGQWRRYREQCLAHPRHLAGELHFGLRLNPMCSTGHTEKYDPCAPGSRLGIPPGALSPEDLHGITGLHFHTLCEQGAEDLEKTLDALDQHFGQLLRLPQITSLNLGGGHWITKPDYNRPLLIRLLRETKERYQLDEIWLEPGEASAIHTGELHASVLDLLENSGIQNALLDVSATAHMPDVLEMPYRPDVRLDSTDSDPVHSELPAPPSAFPYRLGGPTCLSGDVIGDFSFPRPLRLGDRLIFDDMAHYTLVKTTTFNGVRHPAIVLKHEDDQLETVREFTYADFRTKLG
ncbi:MAG: carboxynorspermidine decarboxylase [Verrucomicrobiales bacterium]